MRCRPPVLAAALLLALPGLAACGDDDDAASAGPDGTGFELAGELTPDQMVATVGAVCDAAGQAPTDPLAAEITFNGKAHDGLHSIARQLEAVDRSAAATLLKAKERVESDFAKTAANDAIRTDLVALAAVAGASVGRIDPTATPPACS